MSFMKAPPPRPQQLPRVPPLTEEPGNPSPSFGVCTGQRFVCREHVPHFRAGDTSSPWGRGDATQTRRGPLLSNTVLVGDENSPERHFLDQPTLLPQHFTGPVGGLQVGSASWFSLFVLTPRVRDPRRQGGHGALGLSLQPRILGYRQTGSSLLTCMEKLPSHTPVQTLEN